MSEEGTIAGEWEEAKGREKLREVSDASWKRSQTTDQACHRDSVESVSLSLPCLPTHTHPSESHCFPILG